MNMWIGGNKRIIMYPCNNNTIMNFVAIHPSGESSSKREGEHFCPNLIKAAPAAKQRMTDKSSVDWNRGGSKDTLLETYKDFPPAVQALLNLVDGDSVKAWTLFDMERIPNWYKGKAVLLGDAAHPFLPRESPVH